MSDSVRPHRRQPTRFPHPWDSPHTGTDNTHQNSLMVEEIEFVSSDSIQQIHEQALLSECKQYRSAGEHIQATKQTTRPAKELYHSVCFLKQGHSNESISRCKLQCLIFSINNLFLVTDEAPFYIGNYEK